MYKEKTLERRIQTLSLESSFSSCILSPSNLKDTLLKIYIYLLYLNSNIETTKKTSASLERAKSYFD